MNTLQDAGHVLICFNTILSCTNFNNEVAQLCPVYLLPILNHCLRSGLWRVRQLWRLNFPAGSWGVIASFDVFALKGVAAELEGRPDAKRCLRKLVQVFDLDAEKLFQQFTAFLPMATAIQRQGGLDYRKAWTTALNPVQARQSQQKKWPSTELGPAGFGLKHITSPLKTLI